jgi:hypothetical protein
MRLNVFFLKIIAILISCMATSLLYAADKYCIKSSQSKTYNIHIFGYTFKDINSKKQMARDLTELHEGISVGDRIRVYNHNPSGFSLVLDQCAPGCPEKKFLDSLTETNCYSEVAKRDRKIFNNKFAVAVMGGITNTNINYDIFKAIQELNDVYKGGRTNNIVAVAISMIPDGIDIGDPNAFNKFFVTNVPNLKIALNFPPVCTIGTSPNSEVLKFWREVFSLKSIKYDIKSCIKD